MTERGGGQRAVLCACVKRASVSMRVPKLVLNRWTGAVQSSETELPHATLDNMLLQSRARDGGSRVVDCDCEICRNDVETKQEKGPRELRWGVLTWRRPSNLRQNSIASLHAGGRAVSQASQVTLRAVSSQGHSRDDCKGTTVLAPDFARRPARVLRSEAPIHENATGPPTTVELADLY